MAVPLARAKIVGVYWRRAAMRACVRTSLVDTLFITRRTFSGSRKTIELDPETARREYLESIRDSDFVIAPKGDGNYSNRFLKALALGRFPILIDTDCVLPFENKIDYSKVIVRVPMNGVKNTPRYVRNFYDPLSPEEFAARQKLAREIFEKYLRQDSFFRAFFEAQPRQN
ncbi:MAG TPA: exostosin family protein [Candidatus Paceibacterota bacterium]|nr:exostosin family protein [Candidatus Paceibacterota bacterium]